MQAGKTLTGGGLSREGRVLSACEGCRWGGGKGSWTTAGAPGRPALVLPGRGRGRAEGWTPEEGGVGEFSEEDRLRWETDTRPRCPCGLRGPV